MKIVANTIKFNFDNLRVKCWISKTETKENKQLMQECIEHLDEIGASTMQDFAIARELRSHFLFEACEVFCGDGRSVLCIPE